MNQSPFKARGSAKTLDRVALLVAHPTPANLTTDTHPFLAALSISGTTVVGPSVGLLVRWSTDVCEKVTLRVSKGH